MGANSQRFSVIYASFGPKTGGRGRHHSAQGAAGRLEEADFENTDGLRKRHSSARESSDVVVGRRSNAHGWGYLWDANAWIFLEVSYRGRNPLDAKGRERRMQPVPYTFRSTRDRTGKKVGTHENKKTRESRQCQGTIQNPTPYFFLCKPRSLLSSASKEFLSQTVLSPLFGLSASYVYVNVICVSEARLRADFSCIQARWHWWVHLPHISRLCDQGGFCRLKHRERLLFVSPA
jgi:hypothetical protein